MKLSKEDASELSEMLLSSARRSRMRASICFKIPGRTLKSKQKSLNRGAYWIQTAEKYERWAATIAQLLKREDM